MDVRQMRKYIAGGGAERADQREADDLPEKADLEAIVEGNTKCGKCSGKVRALIEDAQPGDACFAGDIDFKVAIYCPASGCEWTVTQWRPWKKSSPKEL